MFLVFREASPMPIRFGSCALDADRHELRRDDAVAHLSPHAFELLALLVAHRPRPLSKEELLDRLWPHRIVTEASLAGLVTEIRHATGDDAREPKFLRTVHAYGYAFTDQAAATPDERAVCRVVWGASEIPLSAGDNLVGRDPDAAIAIDDPRVSRHHARIVVAAEGAVVEDLGSKNGTWSKGRRIVSPEPLADGDEIRIGPAVLVFRAFVPGGATATALE
jgi:DNA-binding winged helix-turn-helix (wHTH) protein